MMQGYLRRFPWAPMESRKPFNESIDFIKRACQDHRHAVDRGCEKLEDMTSAK